MLLQTGPLPLYHQLEQALRARLTSSEFKPGDLLPSEERICELYGVSRITVRRALDALIAQGMIIKKRGVGSFVAEPRAGARSIRLKGSLDEFLAGAGVMEPDHFDLTRDAQNPQAAAILNLPDDALMTCVRMVSRIDGEPTAYLEIYFPDEVGQQLDEADLLTPGVPIIRGVERRLNVRVSRAEQKIESGSAGEIAGPLLELQPSDPVLLVTRAYYLANGQAIETAFVRYHPSRYSYVIEFNADSRS